ncbi:TetR/AcrR family transcriptional regulator [Luteimonas sp. RD2P54]|uniref:TetR/AcrR family transcriptional regulator n=1 Tax=Luteimonas endophytica TaxID=3042023 RepID=A0ABT6J517_9GAMM|nr:TetR/AcrR family transcriptional regulator [Luteimonas endophytica]MDH5821705.1 TetR/AcrR family transcriptional regulator [Luteimonas endophytica]
MNRQPYHHGNLPSALLQAAEEELALHGIERFSLRAVAKRAGVSHAAPAHHFRDLRGMLTALAARGYERLLAFQGRRQAAAAPDPRARIVASGLGYIDFAIAHPALFRLMFASDRPDRDDPRFATASLQTFEKLVAETEAIANRNPYRDPAAMKDLMASWALVHGLAELIVSGRAERPLGLSALQDDERDALLTDIVQRLASAGG